VLGSPAKRWSSAKLSRGVGIGDYHPPGLYLAPDKSKEVVILKESDLFSKPKKTTKENYLKNSRGASLKTGLGSGSRPSRAGQRT